MSLRQTHFHCNRQAIEILKNNGRIDEATTMKKYLQYIDSGTVWIDRGFRNFKHFYNPVTGNGFPGWISAKQESDRFINKAETLFAKEVYPQAFFYIGAAVHLIQDLCVPHHTHNTVMAGHEHYEVWVERHFKSYPAPYTDLDSLTFDNPEDLLVANAGFAYKFMDVVRSKSQNDYASITAPLLSRAKLTTAGLFAWFYARMSTGTMALNGEITSEPGSPGQDIWYINQSQCPQTINACQIRGYYE